MRDTETAVDATFRLEYYIVHNKGLIYAPWLSSKAGRMILCKTEL